MVRNAGKLIPTDARPYAEIPLIAPPGLVHFRSTCLVGSLGRTWPVNDSGIHGRASKWAQALLLQQGIDPVQHFCAQSMKLKVPVEVRIVASSRVPSRLWVPSIGASTPCRTARPRLTGRSARTTAAGAGCVACLPAETADDRGRVESGIAARSAPASASREPPDLSGCGTARGEFSSAGPAFGINECQLHKGSLNVISWSTGLPTSGRHSRGISQRFIRTTLRKRANSASIFYDYRLQKKF
jgi:hypothetical protein